MRERRAAHVRPLPPSGDRLRSRQIAALAPPPELLRRYKPVRSGTQIPPPLSIGAVAVFLVLGVAVLVVGGNILVGVAGQLGGAFDNAMSRITSMAPATVAPSGVALDTPVLEAPPNSGYTNQPVVSLAGTVPADVVGKDGYMVRIYAVASDGTQSKVAEVNVGPTARFETAAVKLVEGRNTFVATLVTPTSEGQPSPEVVYILDTKAPTLSVSAPTAGSTQTGNSVVVSGKTDPGVTVTIRNVMSPGGGLSTQIAGQDGTFAITVPLVAGSNTIVLTATDQAGNVTTTQIAVKRSYGQLAAHLRASPAKFPGSGPTTLVLTLQATSAGGGPMAGASAVFTVSVVGLGPIVSPEVTTNAKGTATWKVTISGAWPGIGQATALVTASDGDQVSATTRLTTT
ncbi:MAG: hypothetical protein ABSA21_12890 [Candidatus Limnocylindrales bacterium]